MHFAKKAFCSIFIVVVFFAHAWAAQAVQIDLIKNSTPQVDTVEIPGLNQISEIYKAGTNAWAVDQAQSKVAIYNSSQKKWNDALAIPGATQIYSFKPAYPSTGQDTTAWALIAMANNKMGISYFDGNNWSTTPEDVSKLVSYSSQDMIQIMTSGGALFLFEITTPFTIYDTTPPHMLLRAKKSANSDWSAVQNLNNTLFVTTLTNNGVISDDSHPAVYFIAAPNPDPSSSGHDFYRFNGDGTLDDLSKKSDFGIGINSFMVKGTQVYLNTDYMVNNKNQNELLYKDLATTTDWVKMPTNILDDTESGISLTNENSGHFCSSYSPYDSTGASILTGYECWNPAQKDNSGKLVPFTSGSLTWSHQVATIPNGVWLSVSVLNDMSNVSGNVYYYDEKNSQFSDTHFQPNSFPYTEVTNIIAVGENAVLACHGHDPRFNPDQANQKIISRAPKGKIAENNSIQLSYYNSADINPIWHVLPITTDKTLTQCNFSFNNSDSLHSELNSRNADDTLWLY